MNRLSRAACMFCGAFYSLTGGLLFLFPGFFFHAVAPIGPYNRHYAVDLGSFLLPLGVFLIAAAWKLEWSQPVTGLAAFGSFLHLLSHLRDASLSSRAIAADLFFMVIAGLLFVVFWTCGRQAS